MRTLQRHRRSLTWIASLAAAVGVATAGATAVLAEDPACVVNGTPITQEQAAADPALCPAPAPAPEADPQPEPDPPAPTPEPEPTEPAPDPAPPTTPDPSTGTGTDTGSEGTGTGGDATTTPPPATGGGSETEGGATGETSTTDGGSTGTADPTTATPPADDGTTTTTKPPKPGGTTNDRPATGEPPKADPPASPSTRRTRAIVRAKLYRAAAWRDARTFREHYKPSGRIPRQPQMTAEVADLLVDAAKGTGTSWATLAAVAWIESRWDDPSAGGIVGRRLTAAAWSTYGTDGDGDGRVDRASRADQARTVAALIAAAPNRRAGLRAYFNYSHRDRMATRSILLADYFDALGPYALVHGIDDAEAREQLQQRTLDDERIELYGGGRSDIRSGLIDPRVLVTLRYLANRFDTVAVSSLVSGHGVFTAGGNVSLHAYGQAVDIAALGGEPIVGHQQRGGRTWHAVRDVLLLPEAMQPAELISLWSMGGASFALADHADHIHIGWKTESDAG